MKEFFPIPNLQMKEFFPIPNLQMKEFFPIPNLQMKEFFPDADSVKKGVLSGNPRTLPCVFIFLTVFP